MTTLNIFFTILQQSFTSSNWTQRDFYSDRIHVRTMELELTCSEEPSPRTRGHKDLKSRSGSPCRPLIAASFRSISRLFPREFYFSGQTRHHRETQPVFFGIALAGSKPPFSPSVSSRYQRNQPFPFYYLTGFLSPLEENIFVEIFSGEKKRKEKRENF